MSTIWIRKGVASDARSAAKFGAAPAPEREPIRAVGAFDANTAGHPNWGFYDDRRYYRMERGPRWNLKEHGLQPGTINPRSEYIPNTEHGGRTHSQVQPASTHILNQLQYLHPSLQVTRTQPEEWHDRAEMYRGLDTKLADHNPFVDSAYAMLTDRDIASGMAAPHTEPNQEWTLTHPDEWRAYHNYDVMKQHGEPVDQREQSNAEAWQQSAQPLADHLDQHTLHPGEKDGYPPDWHLRHDIPGHRIVTYHDDIAPHLPADPTVRDYLRTLDHHFRTVHNYHDFPTEQVLSRFHDVPPGDTPWDDLHEQADVYKDQDNPGYRDEHGQWQPGNVYDAFRRKSRRERIYLAKGAFSDARAAAKFGNTAPAEAEKPPITAVGAIHIPKAWNPYGGPLPRSPVQVEQDLANLNHHWETRGYSPQQDTSASRGGTMFTSGHYMQPVGSHWYKEMLDHLPFEGETEQMNEQGINRGHEKGVDGPLRPSPYRSDNPERTERWRMGREAYMGLTPEQVKSSWAFPTYSSTNGDIDGEINGAMSGDPIWGGTDETVHPNDYDTVYPTERGRWIGNEDHRARNQAAWDRGMPLQDYLDKHGHSAPHDWTWHVPHTIHRDQIIHPIQDTYPSLPEGATLGHHFHSVAREARKRWGHDIPTEEILPRLHGIQTSEKAADDLAQQAEVYHSKEQPGYRDRDGQWQPGNIYDDYRHEIGKSGWFDPFASSLTKGIAGQIGNTASVMMRKLSPAALSQHVTNFLKKPPTGIPNGVSLRDHINTTDYYHGGSSGLNPQNLDVRQTSAGGHYGPGVYLSESPHEATQYAQNIKRTPEQPQGAVYHARLNVQNPLDIEGRTPFRARRAMRDAWREHAAATGKNAWSAMPSLHDPSMTFRDHYYAMAKHTDPDDQSDWSALKTRINSHLARHGYDALTTTDQGDRHVIALSPNDEYGHGRSGSVSDFSPMNQGAYKSRIHLRKR